MDHKNRRNYKAITIVKLVYNNREVKRQACKRVVLPLPLRPNINPKLQTSVIIKGIHKL